MLTKTERRKIALRNLRKAWAAKGVRKKVRKNMRATHGKTITSAYRPTTIAGSTVGRFCEVHGPTLALTSIMVWCGRNALHLERAGLVYDAAAYRSLIPVLRHAAMIARSKRL